VRCSEVESAVTDEATAERKEGLVDVVAAVVAGVSNAKALHELEERAHALGGEVIEGDSGFPSTSSGSSGQRSGSSLSTVAEIVRLILGLSRWLR
jgi:hypothetical protein